MAITNLFGENLKKFMKQKIRHSPKNVFIKHVDKCLFIHCGNFKDYAPFACKHISERKKLNRYIKIHSKYGYPDIF